MQRKQLSAFLLSIALLVLSTPGAVGQKRDAFRIDYTVSVASIEEQLFHVSADIKNINEPRLDLALPTWTPGWYTVENYFKNVLRFRITDASGKILPHTMSRKQTWNVDTKGIKQIRIDYDYRATVLALSQAKI